MKTRQTCFHLAFEPFWTATERDNEDYGAHFHSFLKGIHAVKTSLHTWKWLWRMKEESFRGWFKSGFLTFANLAIQCVEWAHLLGCHFGKATSIVPPSKKRRKVWSEGVSGASTSLLTRTDCLSLQSCWAEWQGDMFCVSSCVSRTMVAISQRLQSLTVLCWLYIAVLVFLLFRHCYWEMKSSAELQL